MPITYHTKKTFTPMELESLFLSVEWSSGHYPDKLAAAMQGSATVISAYDGDRLVGLINALDDGVMTAYIHYLLVSPDYQSQGIGRELVHRMTATYADYLRIVLVAYEEETAFYQQCGFTRGESACPMFITSLCT